VIRRTSGVMRTGVCSRAARYVDVAAVVRSERIERVAVLRSGGRTCVTSNRTLRVDTPVRRRAGEPDSFNAFRPDPRYININGQLASNVRFRITPDVRRIHGQQPRRDAGAADQVRVRRARQPHGRRVLGAIRGAPDALARLPRRAINRIACRGPSSPSAKPHPGSSDFGVGLFYSGRQVQSTSRRGIQRRRLRADGYEQVQERAGALTLRPFAGAASRNGFRLSGFYNEGWYAADRPAAARHR